MPSATRLPVVPRPTGSLYIPFGTAAMVLLVLSASPAEWLCPGLVMVLARRYLTHPS